MAGRIPSTGQIISDRGPTGLDFDRQELIKLQEADKNEIALDIAQFILDMTGIIDPTPVSDGTSAIISLTRGRWIDALISSVSIIPYIGDVAKLGKLPRYLKSIKKAVQISRRDQAWFFALKKLLIPLKKVVDQFYELSSKSLPGKYSKILREIKLEINKVVNNSPNGLTVKEAKAAMEAAENKLRPPRTKHSSGTTKKPDITKETSGKNSKIEGGVKNGNADEAFHYTEAKWKAAIDENGLRPGSYATPAGDLSPRQAAIELALPPNRNLPDAKLRIDLEAMRKKGFEIPEPTRVSNVVTAGDGRVYTQPGGGYEMKFDYEIPSEFISIVE